MFRLYSTILAVLLLIGCVSAFAPSPALSRTTIVARMAARTEESTYMLQDSKGNDLRIGTIIKVTTENLKAYQVNKKGQGSFVDGKFVKAAEGTTERGKKNLVVPVGMCGIVTKLYNVEDVAANCPICARFEPGQHNDDGFDPPVKFLMHFTGSEIEAVM